LGKDSVLFDETDLKREMLILSLVKHENIIKYNGYWEAEIEGVDKVYFIMEYADQGTLHKFIADKSRAENMKKHILYQISASLAFLHSLQICHRDLSPDNILICSTNLNPFKISIKLSDFGISRVESNKNETITKIMGKPKYMSPELIFLFETGEKKFI